MNITRRALIAGTPLALLGLTAGSCITTAPPAPTAIGAAVVALQGVIASVQAMIDAGGLSAANLAAAAQQIASLQAQIAVLTAAAPAAAQTTIASVFDTVTTILTQMAQYLPLILSIIGMLATPAAKVDTPEQAKLRANWLLLRSLAGK